MKRDRERGEEEEEKKEKEKEEEKKSPNPASKRLDSEPKRNKLLRELVAPSWSPLLSLRTDATPPLAVECAGRPPGTKIHI